MQVPAVMVIETALEQLKNASPHEITRHEGEEKELISLGEERVKQIKVSGLSVDFQGGYALGLQTARVMIASHPQIILNNIDPKDIL